MYTPHTNNEVEAMLKAIGVNHIEDLFQEIPEKYRFPKLDMPSGLSEMETMALLQEIASANATTKEMACFLGAGAYDHYVPAAVDMLLRRGEFYTAYTPYQPEISQGTLQTVFEYQSLICRLTGMDVSNASHYDGATACAEAAILAYHHYRGKRKKIILSRGLHPQYREVIHTYLQGYDDLAIIENKPKNVPFEDPQDLINQLDLDTSLVIVQYPDFFGRILDYKALVEAAHGVGALVAVSMNPIGMGLLTPPGEFGADIVVGEGQPLGLPLAFGGPYLGLFAVKNELVRKIAGRLVGETTDVNGQLAYVLTLTAREQHIRREKATSNICSNQGLMVLASTIYLSMLGKQGLRKVAELCYHKAHYAAQEINKVTGYKVLSSGAPFFHEFLVQCPKPVSMINAHLEEHGIIGGYDVSNDYPELENCMLLAVTEKIHKEDIDYLCEVLQEVDHD